MAADRETHSRFARTSRLSRALVLGLVVGAASPLAASADQASDEAATLMQSAADAYGKGDYATCRARATEAWTKFQHAQIAGLLGSCEVKLGMFADGATHLDFYLKSSTGDVNPDAKRLLDEAREHVAEVTLACRPEGVAFKVDGRPLPPGAQTVFVDPGQHVILAEKEGYEPKQTPQAIAAGTKIVVTLELEPKRAGVRLPAWPGEVAIAIGGLAIGTSIGLFGAASGADTTATSKGTALKNMGVRCNAANTAGACSDLASAVSRHNAFGNAAIGTLVGGVVFAAAGIVYLPLAITSAKGSDEHRAALAPSIAPVVGTDVVGAIVTGRF